jgi:hypothetical protein
MEDVELPASSSDCENYEDNKYQCGQTQEECLCKIRQSKCGVVVSGNVVFAEEVALFIEKTPLKNGTMYWLMCIVRYSA